MDKRVASLHITEEVLIKIIREVNESFQDAGGHMEYTDEEYARRVLVRAKSFSVASRAVFASNNKLEHKVEKLKLASRSNAGMFASLLLYSRRQLHHRGLQLIRPGMNDWLGVKEITNLATEFCNEAGINIKEGYKEYIKLGLGMMKNFSLYKFKSIHAAVCNKYEAIQEIQRDKTPNLTKQAHSIYLGIISDKIGTYQGYEDNPEKYKHFIQAVKEAKGMGIGVKSYLQAQFNAFDWRSGFPDPAQLYGLKAKERVQKWAFENNIQLGKAAQGIDFKAIKKRKHAHHTK